MTFVCALQALGNHEDETGDAMESDTDWVGLGFRIWGLGVCRAKKCPVEGETGEPSMHIQDACLARGAALDGVRVVPSS